MNRGKKIDGQSKWVHQQMRQSKPRTEITSADRGSEPLPIDRVVEAGTLTPGQFSDPVGRRHVTVPGPLSDPKSTASSLGVRLPRGWRPTQDVALVQRRPSIHHAGPYWGRRLELISY